MAQLPPPQPRRLLALDPGERRIGVALSDELGLYAHPRAALDGRAPSQAIAAIAALVEREGLGEVIVGLPLSLSGQATAQTEIARRFAARLRNSLSVPVSEWDERLSTVEAARSMPSSKRRSGELDSTAAAIVLQAVLDARREREPSL